MTPAPAQQGQLLRVALGNVHLFKAPSVSPHILDAIAEVTGIPASLLVQTDWRISRTGSLAPLRDLFTNAAVPRADDLRYEVQLKQTRADQPWCREHMAQRLTLALVSSKGRVEVDLTVALSRRGVAPTRERQIARIRICYKVDAGALHQAYRQEVTIAGDRPRQPRTVCAQAA